MTTSTQLRDVLNAAIQQLGHSSTDSARLDAEVLLAHVLDKQRVYLLTWPEQALNDEQRARYQQLVSRRLQGVPIAYLTGTREFWSLALTVSSDTLIPRPDTETLVSIALQKLPGNHGQRICDLGTGSGAIALALASERPDCELLATDISAASLKIAMQNATQLGLKNVRFQQSDWFSALAEQPFELIVSNPPYIAIQDPHLTQGDVAHEPHQALISGPEGLDDLLKIASVAQDYLCPTGWLLMEHGWQQAEDTRSLLLEQGYQNVSSWQDETGNMRVSGGQRPTDSVKNR